jgi:inhibitor of KinA
MADGFRIFPLGDAAMTVEFGDEISVDLNQRAIALSDHFESHPFPGFIETVPAYASTTIFYDVVKVRRAFPESVSAFEIIRSLAEAAIKVLKTTPTAVARSVEIPVHFDSTSGPDLGYVAQRSGLSEHDVIEIFTGRTYRVFMLGFLPGFTYMAEVDSRIATPRREAPRTSVPKGSVGIAGKQTGIYSLESPGGWPIVGRTDVELFSPDAELPTLLQPGDEVRYVSVK